MRKLTYEPGSVDEPDEPGWAFTAGINVVDADAKSQGVHAWLSRIEVHGDTAQDAKSLRDHILTLLGGACEEQAS